MTPIKNKMTLIGKLTLYSGMVWGYDNGDMISYVWRWWHPLCWVIPPTLFILMVIVDGIVDAWKYKHQFGFGVDPYIKNLIKQGKYTGRYYICF